MRCCAPLYCPSKGRSRVKPPARFSATTPVGTGSCARLCVFMVVTATIAAAAYARLSWPRCAAHPPAALLDLGVNCCRSLTMRGACSTFWPQPVGKERGESKRIVDEVRPRSAPPCAEETTERET